MGAHVTLDIDPRGIDARAWAKVHDDTLALLAAWRPRLLGWGWRTIEGVEVPVYTRSIRGDEGACGSSVLSHAASSAGEACWSVAGDRETLRTCARRSLYRDLRHYTYRRGRRATGDIVVEAARADRARPGLVRVLGDDPPSAAPSLAPCHFAVLAAAMLVEERFPRHAMVSGEIDRGQAEEARRLAAPLLGRALPVPVRVDAARLIERLRAGYNADALPGAFRRVVLGGTASGPPPAGDDTGALAALGSADAMDERQRAWARGMAWSAMRVLAGLRESGALRAKLGRVDEGRALLARVLAEREPVLTEDAWDAIRAERDAEVIAWWIALASMDASEIHAREVRRAFFENAEIRRYAIAVGRDERAMRAIGERVAAARAGLARDDDHPS